MCGGGINLVVVNNGGDYPLVRHPARPCPPPPTPSLLPSTLSNVLSSTPPSSFLFAVPSLPPSLFAVTHSHSSISLLSKRPSPSLSSHPHHHPPELQRAGNAVLQHFFPWIADLSTKSAQLPPYACRPPKEFGTPFKNSRSNFKKIKNLQRGMSLLRPIHCPLVTLGKI